MEFIAVLFTQSTVDGRAIGTLGEPNSLAAWVLFLWPFAFFGITSGTVRRKKVISSLFFIVIFLLTVCIIILSGSRSGIIGFGIQLTFFGLQSMFGLSLSKTTGICVVLLLLSLFFPFIERTTVQTQYENRADIWKAALLAGYEHPFVGWGFGNTELALKQEDHKLWNRVQGYYVDSSHNIFLDWWVQGGFVGISVLVILVYAAIRQFIKQRAVLGIGLLLGLLVSLSFNPASVVTFIAFWFLIGQILFSVDTAESLKNHPFFGKVGAR